MWLPILAIGTVSTPEDAIAKWDQTSDRAST